MHERTESTTPERPFTSKPGRQPQRIREERRRAFEEYCATLPDETLLTTPETADYTGFPVGTLRNSRSKSGPQSGRLGGIKAPEHITDGHRVYYRLGALREWRKKYEARFKPRITTADA